MKNRAIKYYRDGCPCGQCLILAARDKYELDINDDLLKAMLMVSNGFGYGGMCAAAASAVMIFSIMFDEDTAKEMRLEFLERFKKNYRSFNCCVLSDDCENIIGGAAKIADDVILSRLSCPFPRR